MPIPTSADLILAGIRDIVDALKNPHPATPIAPITTHHHRALKQLTELLTNITDPECDNSTDDTEMRVIDKPAAPETTNNNPNNEAPIIPVTPPTLTTPAQTDAPSLRVEAMPHHIPPDDDDQESIPPPPPLP